MKAVSPILAISTAICLCVPLEACDAGDERSDTNGTEGGDTGDDGGGGSTSGSGGDGSTDDTGMAGEDCHGLEPGPQARGEPCNRNSICRSNVCEIYKTFPPEGAGTCLAPPADCRTLVTGTLRDLLSREPIEGIKVAVIPGAEAVVDPSTASRFVEGVSGPNGIVDMVTEDKVEAFYAVTSVVLDDAYAVSVGFLGSPVDHQGNYEPAFSIRSWWGVQKSDLNAWNAALSSDPEIADDVPLQENGGVIGVVVSWGYPSDPVADAVLIARDETSTAKVRYLDETGRAFSASATTSSGLFIVTDTQVGEVFDVEVLGTDLTGGGRPGVVKNGIYVMEAYVGIPEDASELRLGTNGSLSAYGGS